MRVLLLAFIFGVVPNFMFGFGTGLAVKERSPWPAVVYIIGSFVGFTVGIFLNRRHT